jgi:glycosyltransferase involved in cell wall biosynthesis
MTHSRPIAVVAHPGSQVSLDVSCAMARHGLLRWHLTGVYKGLGWFGRLAGRWVNRFHPEVPAERIRVRSRDEIAATLIARASGSADMARAVHVWRNRRFGRWAGAIAAREALVLHGFETAALEAFEIAQPAGVKCVLHVVSPTARFTRAVHSEQRLDFPDLADTLPKPVHDERHIDRHDRELTLADRIVVNSRFMQQMLVNEGTPLDRVEVIPCPTRLDGFFLSRAEMVRRREPLFRAIYVGNLTQHNGLGYLLEAWRQLALPEAELLLVGSVVGEGRWLEDLPPGVRHIPRVPRELVPS